MTTACLAPNGMSVFRGESAATRLLVGTAKGLALLERSAGTDWTLTGSALDGMHVSSLLIEPVNGGVYAGIHRGGVHFSADGGRTWENRSTGITIEHVYALVYAIAGGKPVVYAGTEPPSLFRSRDEGRNWDELPGWHDMPGMDKWLFPMPPKIPHTKTLAVDPRDPNVIYVGVEQAGLFVTKDGGQTWRELDSYSKPEDEAYRDIHQIALRPNHPDELFMTTGMGLYHSLDRGETWAHITQNFDFPVGYPDRLIFSPQDDKTMFMCGAFSNPGTWISKKRANATVIVSHDLGRTWAGASNGMPGTMSANLEAMSLYAGPKEYSLFAGATNGNIYTSDDAGQNWRLIGDFAPVSKVEHYKILLPGAVSSRRQAEAQAH